MEALAVVAHGEEREGGGGLGRGVAQEERARQRGGVRVLEGSKEEKKAVDLKRELAVRLYPSLVGEDFFPFYLRA